MVRVPTQSLVFEAIHEEVKGAEKRAFGIFAREDLYPGIQIYLQNSRHARREKPVIVKNSILPKKH